MFAVNKVLLTIIVMIILSFASCGQSVNKTSWTKKYKQGLYHYLDSTSKITIPDPIEREKFVQFSIKKYKEGIPDGQNSVSKDSLHRLTNRISTEFALEERKNGRVVNQIPLYVKWTSDIEKNFQYTYSTVFNYKKPLTSVQFCDCIISQLKSVYPDSLLLPTPKPIMAKATIACKQLLVKSKDDMTIK